MSLTRTIKVSVSASGKGLTTERLTFETSPFPNEKALAVYHKISRCAIALANGKKIPDDLENLASTSAAAAQGSAHSHASCASGLDADLLGAAANVLHLIENRVALDELRDAPCYRELFARVKAVQSESEGMPIR